METAIKLGHTIGNMHRPIKITNNKIYFPIQSESEIELFQKLLSNLIDNIDIKSDNIILNPNQVMIFMDTDIDRVDISLLQMSDSFFPTGLYATSNGLESLSQIKKLKRKDISRFITIHLRQVIGPSDCALGNAYESCRKRDFASLPQINLYIL